MREWARGWEREPGPGWGLAPGRGPGRERGMPHGVPRGVPRGAAGEVPRGVQRGEAGGALPRPEQQQGAGGAMSHFPPFAPGGVEGSGHHGMQKTQGSAQQRVWITLGRQGDWCNFWCGRCHSWCVFVSLAINSTHLGSKLFRGIKTRKRTIWGRRRRGTLLALTQRCLHQCNFQQPTM